MSTDTDTAPASTGTPVAEAVPDSTTADLRQQSDIIAGVLETFKDRSEGLSKQEIWEVLDERDRAKVRRDLISAQIGALVKNGKAVRLLPPGTHHQRYAHPSVLRHAAVATVAPAPPVEPEESPRQALLKLADAFRIALGSRVGLLEKSERPAGLAALEGVETLVDQLRSNERGAKRGK